MDAQRLLRDAIGVILENKKKAVFFAVAGVFLAANMYQAGRAGAELARKKAALSSFNIMKERYLEGLLSTGALKTKLDAPAAGASALKAVEEAAGESGIRKKITQLKPFEPAAAKDFEQNGVELSMDGVTIGQVIKFLYRVESDGRLLLINDFQMKSGFEDPDLKEVKLRISLVSRK